MPLSFSILASTDIGWVLFTEQVPKRIGLSLTFCRSNVSLRHFVKSAYKKIQLFSNAFQLLVYSNKINLVALALCLVVSATKLILLGLGLNIPSGVEMGLGDSRYFGRKFVGYCEAIGKEHL